MLSETRKADRAKMAAATVALAIEEGAAAHIDSEWYGNVHPRGVLIEIEAARGLCLNIDFDGDSCQPDTYVLSWHISTDSDACLADVFCVGHVNQSHFGKATDIAYGFDGLCDILRNRLRMAVNGTAFSAERERARIAKNGETAAGQRS